MGGGHSVELLADQDAVSEKFRGKKCIMSATLDDLDPPAEPDGVFKELVEWLRRPVEPMGEGVLKSVTVTEDDGEDNFTTKVIADGFKLDAYGFGKGDGTDRVTRWKKVKLDRANGVVEWTDLVSELTLGAWADEATGETGTCITVTILKNPHRLEIVIQDADGTNPSGEAVANALYGLTDRIVGMVQQLAKAKVKASVETKGSGEKSVMVEPMDEHVDFDGFFNKFITIQREKFEKIPGVVIDDPTEGEFVTVAIIPQPDGSEKTSTNSVKHNVNTGSITLEMHDTEGILVNTMYWQLHKDPLQLEAWSITKTGERIVSESIARVVQFDTNQTIERANSWFG
uniref:Uncharacterized protein n=1 Tax=Zooxanthella nutricula TaxID=1333877 RepID=A0A7S2VRI5_9DINO